MAHRNDDGTFRGRRAKTATTRLLIARWVDAEVVRLKGLGMNFSQIADQITAVGRGSAKAITDLPAGLDFPPAYRISAQGCHKAYRRAMRREPALAVEEDRRLDTARLEEMIFALQPGLRRGDPRWVEAAVKVLMHKSRLLGLESPHRVEMTGEEPAPLTVAQFRMLGKMAERAAAQDEDKDEDDQ